MKASRVKVLAMVAIVLMAIVQIVGGVLAESRFCRNSRFGADLRLRRDEIRCAHLGVNSYRIWNREVEIPGFVPLDRPDKEHVAGSPTDSRVHAYPPWHTTMFYFYGWLSERLCLSLMALVFGVCLYFIVSECSRICKVRFNESGLVAALALVLILYYSVQCFLLQNYGVLVLAAFLLMNRALAGNRDFIAGLSWAVMMIKPQIGLLFVWPLLWHRRYVSIIVATLVCVVATVITSFQVHESIMELISQIPEIGRPYGSGVITDKVFRPLVGDCASIIIMTIYFFITGIATWKIRQKKDFLVSCLPAVLVVPLWTYSSIYDRMILLPFFILMAGKLFSAKRLDKWALVGILFCLCVYFECGWSISTSLEVIGLRAFDPAGWGWTYRLVEGFSEVLMFAFLLMFIFDKSISKDSIKA